MKIINKSTRETIFKILGGEKMTLDEALNFAGEIFPENAEENVLIRDVWYFYDDLDYIP